MGKPQRHIRVRQLADGRYILTKKGGFEVTGISYNSSNKSFYSIPATGQRTYHGRDLQRVVQDWLRRGECRPFRAVSVLDSGSVDPNSLSDEQREQLDQVPSGSFQVDSRFVEQNIDKPFFRFVYNLGREKKGLDPLPPLSSEEPEPQAPSRQRLRDCLREWKSIKQNEGCRDGYIADVDRIWRRFLELVGNKPVSELAADDFARWRRWVTKEGKTRANKWHNDHHKCVKYVLAAVKLDKPSWKWPDGLIEWASSWKVKRHVVSKRNRERMPVAVFDKLTSVADQWALSDPEQFPRDSQRGRAKRLQTGRKRDEGVRIGAMLRIAANCALDNVDLRRMQWAHVKLSPYGFWYLDFPRVKAERKVGIPVDRKTPLLPAVRVSLERLRELDPREGFVFRTAAKGPYTESGLNRAWKRLYKAAMVTDWTPKSMRNIAPTLGKEEKLSRDERDAILGHSVGGTSKFYEDDVDERYLLRLVDLVGREYFDGESVEVRADHDAVDGATPRDLAQAQ